MTDSTTKPPFLVRDLMTVGVFTCTPDTPIKSIARTLLERDLEEMVVLEEGHNIGVVGQDELARVYSREDWESLNAEDVMRPGVSTIPSDIPIATAANLMHDQGVRVLYLTHHAGGIEYPAAYISYRHLIRHLAAQDNNELKDLGIKAQRQSPIDIFIQRRDDARNRVSKRPI
jgi:predicted transcriptional regulator